jgi:hypothetical protein
LSHLSDDEPPTVVEVALQGKNLGEEISKQSIPLTYDDSKEVLFKVLLISYRLFGFPSNFVLFFLAETSRNRSRLRDNCDSGRLHAVCRRPHIGKGLFGVHSN